MNTGRKQFNPAIIPGLIIAIIIASIGGACVPPAGETGSGNANNARNLAAQPQIEVEPVDAAGEGYKFLTADSATVTIRAGSDDANRAELFYSPTAASDRTVRLRTLEAQNGGQFTAELNPPQDFNGEVWARVHYSNGESRETERLRLARRDETEKRSEGEQASSDSNANTNNSQPSPTDTDESARADKFTGGKIERALLVPGNGDVKITVNVPAFTMTLWQGGKEIEKYYVGVGRKNFPIPIGMRTADKIILNPAWIPPDSEWVRESEHEPYERIPASDPDNPLGKIKIPLGDAYLLHEAQAPSDIGNLVSHGCVRVMRDDIFDLTKKIARARETDTSVEEIEAARKDSERRVIDLNRDLPVDINYDTMVVEGGKLYVYADVYDRNTNTVENLRQELASYDVDASAVDESTLKAILDRVNEDRLFVVSLADIKSGAALEKGKTEPLTPQQSENS